MYVCMYVCIYIYIVIIMYAHIYIHVFLDIHVWHCSIYTYNTNPKAWCSLNTCKICQHLNWAISLWFRFTIIGGDVAVRLLLFEHLWLYLFALNDVKDKNPWPSMNIKPVGHWQVTLSNCANGQSRKARNETPKTLPSSTSCTGEIMFLEAIGLWGTYFSAPSTPLFLTTPSATYWLFPG